eukprot:12529822-Ditylum_brightwellii.AAC.1
MSDIEDDINKDDMDDHKEDVIEQTLEWVEAEEDTMNQEDLSLESSTSERHERCTARSANNQPFGMDVSVNRCVATSHSTNNNDISVMKYGTCPERNDSQMYGDKDKEYAQKKQVCYYKIEAFIDHVR